MSSHAQAGADPEVEELAGEVAAVVFTNPTSGFGVVELSGGGEADGARASGPLAGLAPGQAVRLIGRWTEHARYGPTFAAVAYDQEAPRSVEALATFLSSSRFRGVGDVLARRLVDAFGLELIEVIEGEPERLAEVRGVSGDLARRVAAAWAEAGSLGALVRRLSEAGLPAALAQAAHRRFGEAAGEVLDADPYALLVVRGAGWPQAEALARAAGVQPLDPRRLAAGAVAAQRQATARHGHTALDDATLLAEARRLLRVAGEHARAGIERAAGRGQLVRDVPPGDSEPLWYTPGDLRAERGMAVELERLLSARSRLRSAGRRYEPEPSLTAEQAEAVRRALTHPVSVLTGGPGTGKTRTVCEVVRACERAGLQLALCAPTGRAAKRLEELTGHAATTVHRLLEARPGGGRGPGRASGDGREPGRASGDGGDPGADRPAGAGGGVAGGGVPGDGAPGDQAAQADDGEFHFGYHRGRRLPHDLVVADEWSMADTRLAWALAQAVDGGAHLLVVGDADQLPSVGSGAVLRDLLTVAADRSLGVPATRLTTIHRQAAASRIVTLAHELNAGDAPTPSGRDGDVFVVAEQPTAIPARVAEIVAVRAPAFFGCAPGDVQVLAPMYRGPAGVDALNARLKERLNPAGGRRPVAGFHEGDRVVATRNDAELDVANGDIGEVVAADPTARTLAVGFPQGVVEFPPERVEDLRPAWCLTVHKAQGGEWPVVVFVLDATHRAMLWRELVYTAVTRARLGLLLVGDAALLSAAARREGAGARRRVTRLAARLAAARSGRLPSASVDSG